MFGGVEDPVKRLRFTGNLSNGHNNAYISLEDLQIYTLKIHHFFKTTQ